MQVCGGNVEDEMNSTFNVILSSQLHLMTKSYMACISTLYNKERDTSLF